MAANSDNTIFYLAGAGALAYFLWPQISALYSAASLVPAPATPPAATGGAGGGSSTDTVGPSQNLPTLPINPVQPFLPDPVSVPVYQPPAPVIPTILRPPGVTIVPLNSGATFNSGGNGNDGLGPQLSETGTFTPPADPTSNISTGIWGNPSYGLQTNQAALISQVSTALAAQGIDPATATRQQIQAASGPILTANAAQAYSAATAGLSGLPRDKRRMLRPRWVAA